jgi:hypothetical protein
MVDIKHHKVTELKKIMYYKKHRTSYENIENSNIILGFQKY